ncbi:retrovirus-related Pol polyprotein from transposon 17.6 [Trichonephila clavipes]|nr:retrovirus-related Pol polyprotein from transposon 17.6 [Trichonephila clavipes]
MVEAGIISKVEEPTEWVSNMVVIDSPKKLRICLDPRPLNEAVQRPHYPIPTADALITKLQGVNYLGHVLSNEGIKLDPKKIRAIEEFATPNCKEDLQRFLGMLEYVPGKNLAIADALSRAQSTTDNFDAVLGQEAQQIQPAKDMPSPAELLMGRKLRTFLPSHREVLRKRQVIQNKIIQNKYANTYASVACATSKCLNMV